MWLGYCIQYMEFMLIMNSRFPVRISLWLFLLIILCWLLFFSQSLKGWCFPGLSPEPSLLILHFLSLGDFIHSRHFTLHSFAHSPSSHTEHSTQPQPRFRPRYPTWTGTLSVYVRRLGYVKGVRETLDVKYLSSLEVIPTGRWSPPPVHGNHAYRSWDIKAT